jgi:hypothetical protein
MGAIGADQHRRPLRCVMLEASPNPQVRRKPIRQLSADPLCLDRIYGGRGAKVDPHRALNRVGGSLSLWAAWSTRQSIQDR